MQGFADYKHTCFSNGRMLIKAIIQNVRKIHFGIKIKKIRKYFVKIFNRHAFIYHFKVLRSVRSPRWVT